MNKNHKKVVTISTLALSRFLAYIYKDTWLNGERNTNPRSNSDVCFRRILDFFLLILKILGQQKIAEASIKLIRSKLNMKDMLGKPWMTLCVF